MANRLPPLFNDKLSPLTLSSRVANRPRVSRKDRMVQSTDHDALSSKYSAFKKGYLEDPYLEVIVNNVTRNIGPRDQGANVFIPKYPIINIGM